MFTIKASQLNVGQYVWLNETPHLIESILLSPKGKVVTTVKSFFADQKVIVLSFEEVASFLEAKSCYEENDGPFNPFVKIVHNISSDNVISFQCFFDSEAQERHNKKLQLQQEINNKLIKNSSLNVGELIDFLSNYSREAKIKICDNEGYWNYVDKSLSCTLQIEND